MSDDQALTPADLHARNMKVFWVTELATVPFVATHRVRLLAAGKDQRLVRNLMLTWAVNATVTPAVAVLADAINRSTADKHDDQAAAERARQFRDSLAAGRQAPGSRSKANLARTVVEYTTIITGARWASGSKRRAITLVAGATAAGFASRELVRALERRVDWILEDSDQPAGQPTLDDVLSTALSDPAERLADVVARIRATDMFASMRQWLVDENTRLGAPDDVIQRPPTWDQDGRTAVIEFVSRAQAPADRALAEEAAAAWLEVHGEALALRDD
jgi:hypothetical protein